MLHLMQQWPERSGHIDLPVPASRTDTSPKSAQHKYMASDTKKMWDRVGSVALGTTGVVNRGAAEMSAETTIALQHLLL